MRKPYTFMDCTIQPETLSQSRLVACNNQQNRYLRQVWRIILPDETWTLVGTKGVAESYIGEHRHSHGAQFGPSSIMHPTLP